MQNLRLSPLTPLLRDFDVVDGSAYVDLYLRLGYVRGLDQGLIPTLSVSSLGVVVEGGKKASESERGMYEVWCFVRVFVFVFEGGMQRVSGRVVEFEIEIEVVL